MVPSKKSFAIQFALIGLLSLGSAMASDFHSPRTAALGGSGHAGPLLNDAILLNPSFTSFLPTYALSANYLLYRSSADPVKGHDLNFSVQDGRSELFQAGFSYTHRQNSSYFHLGASHSVVKRLGMGLSGKFFIDDKTHLRGQDMVFSMSGVPNDWFQTSIIIDNLFESEEGRRHNLYREFIFGTKFNAMGIVLVYFDPHWSPSLPEKTFGHELGVEFVIMQDLFLRVGNFRNAMIPFLGQRSRGYGAGIGWVAPRISFDYGITRALEPVAATAHVFGTTIYF